MPRYGRDYGRPRYRGATDYGSLYGANFSGNAYGGRSGRNFYGGEYGADYFGRYGVRDFDVSHPADRYGAGQAYFEEQYRRERPGRRTEGTGGFGGHAFYGQRGGGRRPDFVDRPGFEAGPVGGGARAYDRGYGRRGW